MTVCALSVCAAALSGDATCAPAQYAALHLIDVGVHEHAEIPLCPDCAAGFREGGKHRVRTLAASSAASAWP